MAASVIPGLCGACGHCHVVTTARGSTFFMCRRAERDTAFMRYPPLPVLECPGFEPGATYEKEEDQ